MSSRFEPRTSWLNICSILHWTTTASVRHTCVNTNMISAYGTMSSQIQCTDLFFQWWSESYQSAVRVSHWSIHFSHKTRSFLYFLSAMSWHTEQDTMSALGKSNIIIYFHINYDFFFLLQIRIIKLPSDQGKNFLSAILDKVSCVNSKLTYM